MYTLHICVWGGGGGGGVNPCTCMCILYCVIFTMYGATVTYMYIIFLSGPYTVGFDRTPLFRGHAHFGDDHFQLESRLVLMHCTCTLDEIHVPMLIVHNCTRLYCLDLAYQYWPSGLGCDRTLLSCDLHMGLFVPMDYMSILCLIHVP